MNDETRSRAEARSGGVVKLIGLTSAFVLIMFVLVEALRFLVRFLSPDVAASPSGSSQGGLKIVVLIAWSSVAILAAARYSRYKVEGFLNRFSQYCWSLSVRDRGQEFRFRKKDATEIFRESFRSLLRKYRKEQETQTYELRELRREFRENLKKNPTPGIQGSEN